MSQRNEELRQRVAALIAKGLTYTQIAKETGVSRQRISKLAEKMGYVRVTVKVPIR